MRRLLLVSCLFVLPAFAQQPASTAVPTPTKEPKTPDVKAYPALCGSCHGADMKGGTGPSILQYIRYHTDIEVTAVLHNSAAHKGASTFRRPIAPGAGGCPCVGWYQSNHGDGRVYRTRLYVRSWRQRSCGARSGQPCRCPRRKIPNFQPRPATLTLTDGQTAPGHAHGADGFGCSTTGG